MRNPEMTNRRNPGKIEHLRPSEMEKSGFDKKVYYTPG
jgi:hypothetical protein